MKYQSTTISAFSETSAAAPRVHECVVSAETSLKNVVEQVDHSTVSHVLVQNQAGQLIGIVELTELLQRLNVANPIERQRWERMAVESVLQWKISPSDSTNLESAAHRALPIDCTAVHGNDGVSAFVSSDDVFVSWQVVKQSLSEAMTDPVTSLPNRLIFERRLKEEMARAARDHHSLAVILFDVDHFKEVNDMYGHCIGDAALYEIARGLKEQLRSYDVLARYGGDEFSAICCGCQPGEIDIPLNRILTNIKTNFAKTAVALPPLSLSIGAAVVHSVRESDRADDIIELADMCLYRTKDNGRDGAFKIELDGFNQRSSQPTQVLPGTNPVDASVFANSEFSR